MVRALINCHLYHSDNTAIRIEGNRIVKTGTNEEIEKELSSSDEVIDVKGMTVVPGFVDSHMHLLELGYYLSNVQLENCHSLADVKEKIQNRLRTLKKDKWMIGRGWNEDSFSDHQIPDKAFLDAVSKDVPIALTRSCGHVMAVNSKALELAQIDEDTEAEGGVIDYEHGILKESAMELIKAAVPKPDVMELEDYIVRGFRYANSCGITTVGSDDFLSVTQDYRDPLDAFEKLSYQERMNIRVVEQCEFADQKSYSEFLDDGYTFDVGNDFFRIGPLKLILDGSLGARTAALSRPYADDPETKGMLLLDDEELSTDIQLAQRFNMPVIAHAIGDRAVDQILKAYEENLYEGNPLHCGIVHCQILRKDQIEKILKLKLSCYFQSLFIDEDASILRERAGDDLAETSYPFKTLYEGTLSSNGSDAPVEMPDVLRGIELAVTRQSIKDPSVSMSQKENLSVEQALDSYTTAGAEQLFMSDRIGKIEEGYLADLVVLDQDITKCDPHEIHNTKVMMTIMDGRTVFER